MDLQEQELWKKVDIGGYAAVGTLFSFTLEAIKNKVESEEMDMKEEQDKIKISYDNIIKRLDAINLTLFDKRFPVNTIRTLKEKLFPEMGLKYKELNTLIKHYVSGASHLKLRIVNKIKECQAVVKQMHELGQEFSKSDRYWEYRNTNPKRIYLEDITGK